LAPGLPITFGTGTAHYLWHRDCPLPLAPGLPIIFGTGTAHYLWHRDCPLSLAPGLALGTLVFVLCIYCSASHAIYKGYISRDKPIVNHLKSSILSCIIVRTFGPLFPLLIRIKLCRNWCRIH
jgi:hypothetical protein